MRTHERPVTGAACTRCGYEFRPLTSADAVAALLDIPTAYRAALNVPEPEVRTRTDTEGWTAIEYAAHAAEVLHSARKRLVLVFEQDHRNVSPPHLEAVRASARGAQPELVLASVSAACRDLAKLVGTVPDFAWERTAQRDGVTVTARDLLVDALHEAHHHALDAHAASGATTASPLLLGPVYL